MSENVVHVFCDCPDCVKRDMIVVRLKERIEHWKGFRANFWSHSDVKRELQKILEGKK